MTKKVICAILLVVCVAGLAGTFLFSGMFQHDDPVKSFSTGNATYKSGAPAAFQHHESVQAGVESFSLSMSVFAVSIRGFEDLFQTADGNAGARLELSKPDTNTLALIVGSNRPPGYIPYVITRSFALNQWHTFDLRIDRNNHIIARFDGAQVVDQTEPTLSYAISDVALGSGLSGLRPFRGQIKNAAVSYTLFARRVNTGALFAMRIVFGLGIVLFVMLFFAWSRPVRGSAVTLRYDGEDSRNSSA
jgi:hypothetical protein